MKFKKYVLVYSILPLLILLVGSSYLRFMVNHDYMVAYEGECDPVTNICFVGCEDDECATEYYYSQVLKYAPNLLGQCSNDITDCDSANICLNEDEGRCSITYCDPDFDGDVCELISDTKPPTKVNDDSGSVISKSYDL